MKEVEIIEADTTAELVQKVNEKLFHRYQLHGSPFAVPTAKAATLRAGTANPTQIVATVCQMMIKPEG